MRRRHLLNHHHSPHDTTTTTYTITTSISTSLRHHLLHPTTAMHCHHHPHPSHKHQGHMGCLVEQIELKGAFGCCYNRLGFIVDIKQKKLLWFWSCDLRVLWLRFFFSTTLVASSSSKSSSTKGDVLEGGGVSLNVRVIGNRTFANNVNAKITTKNDVTSIVCLVSGEELSDARYMFGASTIFDPLFGLQVDSKAYLTRRMSYETRFIFNLLIIFFTAIALRASDESSLVLVFRWFWTFYNKMIRVATSKVLSITFTVLVITASLERLFVVPMLSYESTSSFKELLEVSYHHGVLFVFTIGSRTLFITRFFLSLDVKSFDSLIVVTFALHLGCRALRNFLT
nr:hypothetical protein [Tanacetum cinerariifolium]